MAGERWFQKNLIPVASVAVGIAVLQVYYLSDMRLSRIPFTSEPNLRNIDFKFSPR